MDVDLLVEEALGLKKYSLARLISLVENTAEAAKEKQRKVFSLLRQKAESTAITIGWTGTPGAGKSTLLGKVAAEIWQKNSGIKIGILAIDPSSSITGGSLLGDRTRTRFPLKDKRIYFRSQASDKMMGGLGSKTWPVVRAMELIFDIVFVETVGIGQNEIDVKHLSDAVYLILQPFAGDQIQFMKAGIMEIPDVFIINKCDEEKQARASFHHLESSLEIFSMQGKSPKPPIFLTSALTGKGVEEVANAIIQTPLALQKTNGTRDEWFMRKMVHDQYGKFGLELLEQTIPNLKTFLTQTAYEQAELEVIDKVTNSIKEKLC